MLLSPIIPLLVMLTKGQVKSAPYWIPVSEPLSEVVNQQNVQLTDALGIIGYTIQPFQQAAIQNGGSYPVLGCQTGYTYNEGYEEEVSGYARSTGTYTATFQLMNSPGILPGFGATGYWYLYCFCEVTGQAAVPSTFVGNVGNLFGPDNGLSQPVVFTWTTNGEEDALIEGTYPAGSPPYQLFPIAPGTLVPAYYQNSSGFFCTITVFDADVFDIGYGLSWIPNQPISNIGSYAWQIGGTSTVQLGTVFESIAGIPVRTGGFYNAPGNRPNLRIKR